MQKQMNIPQLRFPEFKEEKKNAYKKHFFKDIFLFSTGKNIKQNEASPYFETPCVRYGELYHMYNEVITEVINKTNLDKSELLFSDGDEILLPSAGEDPLDIGSASALTIKNVAIGRTINILKPAEEHIYSQVYVAYYINHKLKKHISTLAKGVSISNVYNSDLKTLEIILPNIAEQEKNASFFIAIEEKLQTLKKKQTLLEDYKKGVMQRLFSQELRFKDENGNEFANWERKKLGTVCDVVIGGTPSTTNMSYWNGNIGWIGSGELKNGLIKKPTKYITELGLKKSSTTLMPKGTTVLAMTGATLGKIGYLDFDCTGNQSVAGFINLKEMNSKFIFFQMQIISNQILSLAGGAAQTGINKSNIEALLISIPSLPEQTKIANYLSSIDDKIISVQNKINQTVYWKKGILQKMFI
jgi:type I restriction enzyme S subunit